jgi:superfamily II DNA or RNA helicase
MSQNFFSWTSDAGGIVLQLMDGKNTPVLMNNWPSDLKAKSILLLSRLEALCEEENLGVRRLEDGYWIADDIFASLTKKQCLDANLPENIPYMLQVKLSGPLVEPKSNASISWHNKSGTKIPGKELGAIFYDGINYFRIADPLYSLVVAADAFNDWDGNQLDDRLVLVSNLKSALENCVGESLSVDKALGLMRFSHASAVSLDVRLNKDGAEFDPIIFSKEVSEANAESGQFFTESQSLLTPEQQTLFSSRFREQSNAKSTYVLETGHYVFIDPSIRQVVSCIKKYQTKSPEERRRFIKSPQSFIREDLASTGIDEITIDSLIKDIFVETDTFSKRVLEIGLWKPPVIPFIKRNPSTWIPDGYGLKVGEKSFVISESEIEQVAKSIAKAIGENQETIKIGEGVDEIPATNESLEAINVLVEHVLKMPPVKVDERLKPEKPSTPKNPKPSLTKSQKSILRVQDNFQSETFIAQFEKRGKFSAIEVPKGLKSSLKDHQIKGVAWMQECWSLGYPGVLLADDMGLGKTFQTLAFLCWLKERQIAAKGQPILVVAPISLLGNWEKEADIHLDESALGSMALLYSDNIKNYRLNSSTKSDVVEGRSTLDVSKLKSCDWILTNYNTMRDYHISLGLIDFKCIVFDEMQNIKNPKAMMTNAAQALNSEFQIGLTGTPIENSLADIWTIFDTLMPGFLGLGDLNRFMTHYNTENPENLKELKNRLSNGREGHPPPMLRRMKSEVAKDLPPKIEKIIDEVMPDRQSYAYREVVEKGRNIFSKDGKLMMIQMMRSISLHPDYGGYDSANTGDAYISESARLKVMLQLLDEIHKNSEKVLIFVESLQMQEWLAFFIKERYKLSSYPMRIYGDTSADRRTKVVSQFQSKDNVGFDVLLLSPKAAGVGLTLTAASKVIHLTRWWNPAVEDQCTDRVYRIGQEKNVTVYLPRSIHPLYGDGSFDCLIHQIIERKRALSREMLVPMESAGDLDFIFSKSVESNS